MVLRRTFRPKRDEIRGEWRKLNNEKLNDLYSSPNVFRVIKSRKMRFTGHVACEGREGVHSEFCCGIREKDPFEGTGIDWRIILRWIFKKWDG